MKVKTIMLSSDINKKEKFSFLDRILITFFLVFQIIINTLSPFLFGFYMHKTGNLLWLVGLILSLLINIQITVNNKDISIKVLRNV